MTEKRDFGDWEKIQGRKDFGQIHLYEVSLRERRETSEKTPSGKKERLRERGKTSGKISCKAKREFVKY